MIKMQGVIVSLDKVSLRGVGLLAILFFAFVCAFLLAVEHSARAGGREEERGRARSLLTFRLFSSFGVQSSAVQCHRITSLLCLLLLGVGIPSQSFVRVCERESEDNCISDCPCGLTVQISSAQLSLALLLCIYHGVHRRLR